nr:Lar family restriction alleviation protein [Brucella anthropi]
MASELKPCAHCKGAAELDYEQPFCAFPSGKLEKQVAIYCTACDAHMSMCYSDFPEYDHDQMAAILTVKWNTRPAPAPVFLATEDGECNGNEAWEGPLTDEEQGMIDAAWETHKAAKPAPAATDTGLVTVEYQHRLIRGSYVCEWSQFKQPLFSDDKYETRELVTRAEALEDRLAAAEKALEPFADHANDRAVDDTGWRDKETVKIVVSIGDLRKARAVLGGKPS